ncbi:MAG: radical SAM-associated putative lipoprotein [Paludibacter sp.]|nr:radical SAM-associated putative lipoprotein [Paludibacter sp.]
MKRLILKPYDKIIVAILGLISLLTGCILVNPPVEYGVPHADFEIKGTVTDSITSTPVQHVRVTITQTLTQVMKDSTVTHTDTISVKETDSAGKYDVQFQTFPLEELTFKVKAEDIDGVANGGDFNPKQTDVLFKQSELSGGKGWYTGKAVKTIDIKLKKK